MKKFLLGWCLAGWLSMTVAAQEEPLELLPPQTDVPPQEEVTAEDAVAPSPQPAAAELPEEPEPLLRGPIHEAYAEPIAAPDEEPLVVPEAPPEKIEEIPPDTKPDGQRVVWIPGYWSWDSDLKDYIWVSGVWRNAPAGRAWVDGHWEQVDGGYEWVAGRWAPEGQQQAELLPVPPATLEQGPTSEAASEDVFWIPGSWQYRQGRYVWRPGFWAQSYPNWVWVPDHYVTTYQGCYYVPGYWDYPWESRGILFAPYYINRAAIYPGYRFRPSLVVDVSSAFFHLWVRPGYRHYYFGDYYDPIYASYGFYPWYNYPFGYRYGYDPLFTFYYWNFRRRHGIDLHRHFHNHHHYLRQHVNARPPRRHHRGPGGRDRDDIRLTNAQREALVRNVEQREARAINLNRREAIRRQLLEQHRERLRSGGDVLANRATEQAGERRVNAEALMRGAGRGRRPLASADGARPGAVDRAGRPRPDAAADRAGRGPRGQRPDDRQPADRTVDRAGRPRPGDAVDRARARARQAEGAGDATAERAARPRPGDAVRGRPRAADGQPQDRVTPGDARARSPIPTARDQARERALEAQRAARPRASQNRPTPGQRTETFRPTPGGAVPERGRPPLDRGPDVRVPDARRGPRPPATNRPTPQVVPGARPQAGPNEAIRRVPTNRDFIGSGRGGAPAPEAMRRGPAARPVPDAGRAAPRPSRPAPQMSRPAARPAPQMSRPAPRASRPAPQMSRPAPRPAPQARQAAPRGPSPRAQQIQRSFNRRNRN